MEAMFSEVWTTGKLLCENGAVIEVGEDVLF